MAVTNFVVENVKQLGSQTGMDRIPGTSSELGSYIGSCIVTANLQTAGFTYAGANDAILLGVNAAIKASLRTNGTVSMLSVAAHAPGDDSSVYGIWPTSVTISTNDITFAVMHASDQTTEHGEAVFGVINAPMAFYVCYKLAE